MTQIDFYVLTDHAAGDRYQLAVRIAEKARCAGHRVLMHAESPETIAHVDRLLWTFWEQRFIPHGCLGRDEPALNPIMIGNGADAVDEHDVLVNLTEDLPTFFGRFDRLVECVDHDAGVKQASRERFRYYREHGYPLSTHTIS